MAEKVRSVLQLGRYKVGETAYRVRMRATGQQAVQVAAEDEWMTKYHPKVLFDRGLNQSWKYQGSLPKLCHVEFDAITMILTSEFVVEPFVVRAIERSPHTGEFFMQNEIGDWMPESYLHDTPEAAMIERDRIRRMLKNWAT